MDQLLTDSNHLQHFWWIRFLMNSWNSDITKKFLVNVESVFDFERYLEASKRLVTVITKNKKNRNQPKIMTRLTYNIWRYYIVKYCLILFTWDSQLKQLYLLHACFYGEHIRVRYCEKDFLWFHHKNIFYLLVIFYIYTELVVRNLSV